MEAFWLRKQALLDELAEQAGINPLQDRYHAGYIAAANDLLNTSAEELTDD